MALRNAFGDLGLDSTLQAIRDRLPVALGGTGGVKVDVGSSALPSGAATSAKQDTGNTSLGNIDTSTAASKTDLDTLAGTVSSNKVNVNIASGGATGTQYAEGATAATATGTLAMGKSGTTLKAAQTDSSGNLRVDLSQTSANATAIKVDGSAANQPVSGTVTANAGTNLNTSALALDATLTGGTQKTKLVDSGGTNVASVDSSGALAIQSGGSTGSAVPTRAVQVGGSDGTNLRAVKVSSAGVVSVDGSAVTQPVSGTVTANLGTLNGTATSANQTNGSQQSQVVDGSGNVIGSTSNALNVNIRGNITAFSTSTKQSDGSQKSQVVDGSGNVIGSTANALDVNVKSGGITGFSTSANQTNGTQQSQITDGTNIANTLKSDGTAAGQNAQLVAPTHLAVPFTTTTAQAVGTTDAANYSHVSVQINTQGGSSTVTFQVSNDNTNWVSASLMISSASGTSPVTTSTVAALYHGTLSGRYFRVNVTGIVSGTTAGVIEFFAVGRSQVSVGGSITAAGSKTNNNAAPAGSNVGVLPAIANAAQPSNTEGNQTLVSQDLKGNQRIRISDAAGNDRGVNVNASNQLTTVDASSAATGSSVPASAAYIGGTAQTSLPTAATAGNLTGAMVDKFGRQVVLPFAMRDLVNPITQLTLTSTTTETTLIAGVASTFNDLVSLVVINTSGTPTQVDFRDSTAGTVRLSLYVPGSDTRGVVLSAPMPQNAVNNNWTAKCGTSVASVIITGSYIANK